MTTKTDVELNAEMTKKLAEAGEKVEKQQAEKRAKEVKGSHLLPTMTERVAALGLTSEEKSGFIKVQAPGVKGKRVYIARKGGRVDLSGFSITTEAVRQITEAEAQEKHMGKVRGQLDFEKSDEEVLAAFNAALAELAVPNPEPVKAAKPAKEETGEESAPANTEETSS